MGFFIESASAKLRLWKVKIKMAVRAEQLGEPDDLFEEWRNVEVAGAIGKIIFASVPMDDLSAQRFWREGIPVPLDIVPHSYWWEDGADFPRFSEQMLGDDF